MSSLIGVETPAYDLVIVVADADVERFLSTLLIRGIEQGCLRQIHWAVRRDPMRDSGVRQSPRRAIPDVRPGTSRVLVILDQHGCGADELPGQEIEQELLLKLQQAGFHAAEIACIVLEPELEIVLIPVWESVGRIVAAKRGTAVMPSRRQVLEKAGIHVSKGSATDPDEERWQESMTRHPKECFEGLLRCLRLRHQPALFEEVAREVSMASLKTGAAGARLAALLLRWFGARS